jgi:predicted RNase H-like HicB family nuclease
MTRKYSLVIEGNGDGFSAHVPELPTILVTGQSLDQLTARATEAIRIYWGTGERRALADVDGSDRS